VRFVINKPLLVVVAFAVSIAGIMPGTGAQAQQSAAAQVSRLITLGTGGGPLVTPYRSQPANVVVVRDTPYLFDAGNGVLRQLALAEVPFVKIRSVFLTHLHDDHTADVGTVFGMQWDIPGRSHKFDVYGPPGTIETVQGFLKFFQRNAEIRESDPYSPTIPRSELYPDPATLFIGHDIEENGLVFQDDNIKVLAAENTHFQFERGTPAYDRDKSYAYRVETPDRVIVFTGDTGPSKAVTRLAKGADLLVSEVIARDLVEKQLMPQYAQNNKSALESLMFHMEHEHLSSEEIGKMAAAAGVKEVVLTHVVPGRPQDPDSVYIDGVKKYFKGPVILAKDLMEF
jgi:ribonuclease BN (tRNA processing enzyme)